MKSESTMIQEYIKSQPKKLVGGISFFNEMRAHSILVPNVARLHYYWGVVGPR